MNKYFLGLSTIFAMILFFTGCSKSDKGFWDDALKFQKEGKVNEAINSYEMIVEKHSQSPLANKALFEIAKLYHGNAVKNADGKESLKKAVQYYDRIFKEYPKSEEAPKALFMKGFVQSNDFKDFDAAKITFQKFIDTYPNNELAASAKTELQTLGMQPEDILKQNLQSKK
ncbi:MAG: tetratricopeptide repeat protein [Ignavibacteriales bacterium]|nr:tetratricopeptide repeat protein [Ignavibacteriales bacterium]